jgi:serine/threonine protein kinase/tetratricopeptide (TPR) repeat protein
MPVDPQVARTIFMAALDRSDPTERAAFLEEACAGDADLRQRVEALLKAHSDPGGFLDPPAGAAPATVAEPAAERPGVVIGPYKLLEQIGEGGFGVVFLAEQTHPVRRRVALKVLKPGMDTRQVVARFEAERQALAILDHPNIARVFDGGATPSGRPYFVMELVKGVAITEYCDQNQLTPRQRLELFLGACHAVQHAHQKGIIHRDLKPSNILVSVHDTVPVVKVIDFGVAKAVGQELTDKTLFTGFAQMVGTPLYMSPEQAGQSGLDVDTRSDIYSLGVLLYELLTGTTPFDRERFRRAAYDEIRRIIREEDPPRPSTRLSDSGDALPSISARRHTVPAQLTKMVRGELDWIVMKCLEKDRNRRYETANGFAQDVQRHLAGEPVQAVPPSAGYRFRKFARRNRAALMTAGLVLLALLVGSVVSTWQAIRATTAEREAEENLRNAQAAVDQMLTRVSDERLKNVPQAYPVRKGLLEDALQFYEGFLRQRPDEPAFRVKKAEILQSLGRLQWRMGHFKAADASLRGAVDITRTLADDGPAAVEHREARARAQEALAHSLAWNKQTDEGEVEYRRALAQWDALSREVPSSAKYRSHVARCQWRLAELLVNARRADRFDEAEALLRRASATDRDLTDRFPNDPAHRHQLIEEGLALALVLERGHKLDQAEAGLRQLLPDAERLRTRSAEEETSRRVYAKFLLQRGRLLSRLGRRPEAAALALQALEIREKLVEDFPEIRGYQTWLANILFREVGPAQQATNPKQAEAAFRRALVIFEQQAALKPANLSDLRRKAVHCRTQLASILFATERRADAETLWRRALADAEELAREGPQYGFLINQLLQIWPPTPAAEAERVHGAALAILERLVEQDPTRAANRGYANACRRKLVRVLLDSGRDDEVARQWARALQGYDTLAARFPDQPHHGSEVVQAQAALANELRSEARNREAERTFRQAIRLGEKLMADFPGRADCRGDVARSYIGLALSLSALGRGAEADRARYQAVALLKQLTAEFPTEGRNWYDLGSVHAQMRQWDDAIRCFDAAVAAWPKYWDTWSYRGQVYANRGQWDKAVADQTAALRLSPDSWWPSWRRAQAYGVLNEWDKALEDVTRAIELKITLPEAWVLKAAAHAQRDEPEQAVAELRQAVAKGYRDAGRLKSRGDLAGLREREDFRRLVKDLEAKK